MRRISLVLLALSFASRLWAQGSPVTIYPSTPASTSNNLSGTTCPGSGCVTFDVRGYGSVSIQITGTWTGTASFTGSTDGSNFNALNCTPLNSTTAVTSASANGGWICAISGLTSVQVALSNTPTGTAVVSLRAAAVANNSGGGGGGATALSSLTAATTSNTIANGNNPQVWNWAETTSGRIGMTFGETSAATSAGTPYLTQFTTLTGSTATPVNISNSLNGSQTLPAISITPTWNTTGAATAFLLNPTNTASGVGSLLEDLQLGGTSRWNVGLGSWTATSGTNVAATLAPSFAPTSTSTMVGQGLKIAPTINYSAGTPGAGSYEALKIAVTETALPTGTNYLIRASAGSSGTTDKFIVCPNGNGRLAVGTNTNPCDWSYLTSGLGSGQTWLFRTYASDVLAIDGQNNHVSTNAVTDFGFTTSNISAVGTVDTALRRNAAGVLEVDNGTSGSYRELKLRTMISGGTVPGISGCSAGTQTGGATAGTFASGTTGTCTVTLTFAFTAPNGWACHASDTTTPANLYDQSGYTTTTAVLTGTTVSGDVITYFCMGF